MNQHLFRKISIIKYKNKRFQVFMDEKNRYAFLELDDNNKFHYPMLEDFIGLANIFSKNLDKEVFFRNTTNKDNKYLFKTLVKTTTKVVALSTVLYLGLNQLNVFDNDRVEEVISISDDYQIENTIEEKSNDVEAKKEESKEEEIKEVTTEVTTPVDNSKEILVEYKDVNEDMYHIFDSEIDIYDSTALNKFLGEKNIGLSDIDEALKENNNLDDNIKSIIFEFASTINSEYPEIDMRLFYENVKRLTIDYVSNEDISNHGIALAWYSSDTGVIHLNKDIDLSPNSYDLMVFRHEIGHMLSLGYLDYNDTQQLVCLTRNGAYGQYLQEAIDVYISSEPYEESYDFTDFGYGINANELEAIIKAIPDFDISVLANQDVYNIASYLDSVNPNEIKASRFIDLMDMQVIAYLNLNDVAIEKTEFSDIYKYIANTYINYVLKPDMTYDQIWEIRNNLIDNLNRNLNYFEFTNYDEIDNAFINYMNLNNIEINSLSR